MPKFARFDNEGRILAIYSPDIHGELMLMGDDRDAEPARNPAIPVDVIQISDADWSELLANPSTRRWNGSAVEAVPDASHGDQLPARPAAITGRQFFTQLALDGVITEDEAEAAMQGALPKLLADTLDLIQDPVDRFKARMMAKGASTFEMDAPVVAFVAGALDWNEERLLKLWSDASTL